MPESPKQRETVEKIRFSIPQKVLLPLAAFSAGAVVFLYLARGPSNIPTHVDMIAVVGVMLFLLFVFLLSVVTVSYGGAQ